MARKNVVYDNGFDRISVRQKTQKSKIDTQSAGFDSLPAPVYSCVNLSFKGVRMSIDCHSLSIFGGNRTLSE
jgi:hypothetical protein